MVMKDANVQRRAQVMSSDEQEKRGRERERAEQSRADNSKGTQCGAEVEIRAGSTAIALSARR